VRRRCHIAWDRQLPTKGRFGLPFTREWIKVPRFVPTALEFAQLVQAELGKLGYESRISISEVVTMVFARDSQGYSNGRAVGPPAPGVTAIAVARELARGLAAPDPGLIKAVWAGSSTPAQPRANDE
jgi:hypothetical protein